MSGIYKQIQDDLKTALKAKSEPELGTLRLLKSEIQYELTKTGSSEIPDKDVLVIIKRGIKKRGDSIEQFRKGGRDEMADQEEKEQVVLKKYMPEEISEDVISKAIDSIVAEVKPSGPSDMGKVMGQVMAKFKGQNIDGKLVKSLVQKKLQS